MTTLAAFPMPHSRLPRKDACCRLSRLGLIAAILFLIQTAAHAVETISPDEFSRVKAVEAARVEAVRGVYGAVVAIFGEAVGRGGGSGVLIDDAGFVLTNFHVVQAAGKKGKAGLADGKLYDWVRYGIDPGGDLAVIRLTSKDKFPTAPMGDSRTVRQGQWAMAMGNPFLLAEDYRPTVTLGIVSGVERFQPGQGGQLLVYGNCIQVDSSINPGNSGGPLFDLAGRVIGINGRGSFEERGRVNVGVGYAISIEQAKNFLPELLANRFSLHGTLDATFRDEENRVICNQINEDSPAAKKGLRLGDQLLTFEGVAIRSANQFLNLVTTYPAGWPATVSFRGATGEQTITVPLRPIVIKMPQPKVPPKILPKIDPKPGAKPESKPHSKTENKPQDKTTARSDAKPTAKSVEAGPMAKPSGKPQEKTTSPPKDKPAGKAQEKPAAKPPAKPPEPPPEPGKVIDPALNRAACEWLLRRWREDLRTWPGGEVPINGRPAVLRHAGGAVTVSAQPPENAKAQKAVERLLNLLAGNKPLEAVKAIELEGADKARGERAFRVRADDREGNRATLWFSVCSPAGRIQIRLLQASIERAPANEPKPPAKTGPATAESKEKKP